MPWLVNKLILVINKINKLHLNFLLIKDLGFAAKKKLKLLLNFYLKIIPKKMNNNI